MKRNIFLLFFSVLLSLTSCKPTEKVNEYNYLQNVEDIATEVSQKTSVSKIQKGDQLMVLVSAKDMEVVKPFNQNYYSSQSSIVPGAAASNNSPEKGYLVSSEGRIDFPVLGSIVAYDKSLEQLQSELTDKISTYVKNPVVTLRLVNFKITVLGEVARPGPYIINDLNPNILTAIGLAGDLTLYGKRDNILVVRNFDGTTTKERINLMDSSFINSPFYQLKQGDVIYVSANPTKEKLARLDPNTSIYIAVAGTIIGLAGIFITIFKK